MLQDTHLARWSRRLHRAIGFARARVVLRGCVVGPRVCVDGVVYARPAGGTIEIRTACVFLAGLEPTRLVAAEGATVTIGDFTVVNYGALIQSGGGDIEIGSGCLLASEVRVLGAPGRSVRIGKGVWLAHGAVVTPGVTIGDGAVVAAASVVRRDVPARTLAIGNPARAVSLDFFEPDRPDKPDKAGKSAAVRRAWGS
jgi:maltose O-acetyltransferase